MDASMRVCNFLLPLKRKAAELSWCGESLTVTMYNIIVKHEARHSNGSDTELGSIRRK